MNYVNWRELIAGKVHELCQLEGADRREGA